MPSVNLRAVEIIETIAEFEQSIAAGDTALAARDWPQLEALLDAQHRLTHALLNKLDETRGLRPPAFNAEVDRRIGRAVERRADQLRRLIAFNHLVKQRLTAISHMREMRRVNVATNEPARVFDEMR